MKATKRRENCTSQKVQQNNYSMTHHLTRIQLFFSTNIENITIQNADESLPFCVTVCQSLTEFNQTHTNMCPKACFRVSNAQLIGQ